VRVPYPTLRYTGPPPSCPSTDLMPSPCPRPRASLPPHQAGTPGPAPASDLEWPSTVGLRGHETLREMSQEVSFSQKLLKLSLPGGVF